MTAETTPGYLLEYEECPALRGWMLLTEAADELGITRQAMHKAVFKTTRTRNQEKPRERWLRTVVRVGSGLRATYLVKIDEVEALKARREAAGLTDAADGNTDQAPGQEEPSAGV